MVPLTFLWDGEHGFNTVGVGAILGYGCGFQVQNYITLLQGSDTTSGFHCMGCILCI